MMDRSTVVEKFVVEELAVEVHPDRMAAGLAAALGAAEAIRLSAADGQDVSVLFAAAASQTATLEVLTTFRDLPWSRVRGFHLDEYAGISPEHPASFRHFLRQRLTGRVTLCDFHEIDGTSDNLDHVCREYAVQLRAHPPQVALLGIGVNGHLAFNDPGEADFEDPEDVKVVTLDRPCREQQVTEGWFQHIEDVPLRAVTVTIPAILRVPRLVVSVSGRHKAQIVRRTLSEAILAVCPATILRRHPGATLYLDRDAASELGSLIRNVE